MKELIWIIPLVVFSAIFIPQIVRAPHSFYKKEADKIKEYEKHQIKLVFDENLYPSCKIKEDIMGHDYEILGTRTLYRVGVMALGGITVENVEVMLKEFTPQGFHFGPQALNPMLSKFDELSTFSVDPGSIPTRYVEVVSRSKFTTGIRSRQEVIIHYYKNYHEKEPHLPNSIPAVQYIFTLLAHGHNAPSCEKNFVVTVDENDELLFYPAETDSP